MDFRITVCKYWVFGSVIGVFDLLCEDTEIKKKNLEGEKILGDDTELGESVDLPEGWKTL